MDAETQRAELIERWERSATGWGARADRVRDLGMPVSMWMIERLALQPGWEVLELAAGPGDTGFLAAELIQPGGTLICSDASGAMLEIARARARKLGVRNVEFKQLELEWIDLPTASVEAILCRWGLMFALDPETALREARRVLKPGCRMALAVWDVPERNPWATLPTRALVDLGHIEPPDPSAPGMFALADRARLGELLRSAGFGEVVIGTVDLDREHPGIEQYLDETRALSEPFAEAYAKLTQAEQVELTHAIASLGAPFVDARGALRLPGRSLVAAAGA